MSDYRKGVAHDFQKLFDLVKDRTGYPVSVTPLGNQSSHVSMRSASHVTPVHSIFPNPRYERFANYLVAAQCVVLLVKWAAPHRVYDFVVDDQKTADLKRNILTSIKGRGLPADAARGYAESLVNGLMLQLTSSPLEILAVQRCFHEYEDLRLEQEQYVATYLRELSATLAPNVRKTTPQEVYDPSVTMNAAYTLNWAKLSGETTGLLPYEVLGFEKSGRELLDALKSIPSDAPDVYCRTVDAWAAKLGYSGWYNWSLRET